MDIESRYTDKELLQIYRDALVAIDANNQFISDVIRYTRIGWSRDEMAESVLKPFADANKLIDDVMPGTIKATRPSKIQVENELSFLEEHGK